MSRQEYWESEIAFDCPINGKRRTIDECFKRCHSSDYFYRDGKGVMYCTMNRRELQSGEPRP